MGAWELGDPGEVAWRRRLYNVLVLAICWCLAVASMFIQITTTSAVAARMMSIGVATYPLAAFVVCSAATCLPGALAMKRFGRRVVFTACGCLALVGAGLELLALYRSNFGLLVFGAAIQGPSFSQANNYRFVAAEFSPAPFRPRAISLVVAGGVLAAAVGPEAARHLRGALPMYNAGPYILLLGVYVLHIMLLQLLDYKLLRQLELMEHRPAATQAPPAVSTTKESVDSSIAAAESSSAGAPAAAVTIGGDAADTSGVTIGMEASKQQQVVVELPCMASTPLLSYRELLWNPNFGVAALTAALSFAGMAALMSVTPVDMVHRGLTADDATWVVEVHIVAMYLPGLLTGDLLRMTGPGFMMTLGAVLLLAGNGAFFAGSQVWVYYLGMALIGLGWAAAYVAASFVIAGVYAREPRRRLVVQGTTDTLVIALTGVAIGTASTLLQVYGWTQLLVGYMVVHGGLLLLACGYWAGSILRQRKQ